MRRHTAELLAMLTLTCILLFMSAQALGNGTGRNSVAGDFPAQLVVYRRPRLSTWQEEHERTLLDDDRRILSVSIKDDDTVSAYMFGHIWHGRIQLSYIKRGVATYSVTPLAGEEQGDWYATIIKPTGSPSSGEASQWELWATAEDPFALDMHAWVTLGPNDNVIYGVSSTQAYDSDESLQPLTEREGTWHAVPTDDGSLVVMETPEEYMVVRMVRQPEGE